MVRRSKYRNIKTEVDGRLFHSKKEAARYLVLRDLENSGEISDLKCQVTFTITVNNRKICRYIADFTYIENGVFVVEDVKGRITDVYRLKKKLMLACHSIEIRET